MRKASYDKTSRNPFHVKVGQIWENCDPRNLGSYFQILDIREDIGYAVTQRQDRRIGRVRLTRFHGMSNGYRLLRDV